MNKNNPCCWCHFKVTSMTPKWLQNVCKSLDRSLPYALNHTRWGLAQQFLTTGAYHTGGLVLPALVCTSQSVTESPNESCRSVLYSYLDLARWAVYKRTFRTFNKERPKGVNFHGIVLCSSFNCVHLQNDVLDRLESFEVVISSDTSIPTITVDVGKAVRRLQVRFVFSF